MTHQGAACEAASVHFGPTIRRTNILVRFVVVCTMVFVYQWLLHLFHYVLLFLLHGCSQIFDYQRICF